MPGLPSAGGSGGGLTTYRELCSLADDLGQPDLIYRWGTHHPEPRCAALWCAELCSAVQCSAALSQLHQVSLIVDKMSKVRSVLLKLRGVHAWRVVVGIAYVLVVPCRPSPRFMDLARASSALSAKRGAAVGVARIARLAATAAGGSEVSWPARDGAQHAAACALLIIRRSQSHGRAHGLGFYPVETIVESTVQR